MSFWCLSSILPKNEQTQFDLRYHTNNVTKWSNKQYQFQFHFYCSRYGRSKKVRYIYPRIAAFCDVKNPGGEFFTLAGMLTQAKGNFPSFMRLSTSNSFSQVLGSATSAKIFQMTSAFTYIEQRGQRNKLEVSKYFLQVNLFSEALILASIDPQYDKRLFMELP